jgi:histone acetyltransferase (RNA polymerase elongator complex component)
VAAELSAAGVQTVELGVQSLDDEVLELSRRGHTARRAEDACRLLQAHGFSLGIQLMPGLPGDTVERSLQTMERVIALAPNFVRIYPTLVLAGTGLAELYRSGSYKPLSLSEAVALCKRLLLMARRASIPVIRMGIQATDMLDEPGTVLAGSYHPAFRQLVEGALYGDLLLQLLPGNPSTCVVRCHPSRVSDVAGQRRENLERAAARGCRVQIVQDQEVGVDQLVVTAPGFAGRGSLLTDLDY